MKKIGVTGGIGSGKSIICKVLEQLGYPVFYSDIEAKNIIQQDDDVISELIHLLGPETYVKGIYNRNYVASKLFNDDVLREMVNQIIHPAVRKAFDQWKNKQTASLVFNEAAILFETGAYKQFDATILITAPEQIRIKRIQTRDNLVREQILDRIKTQFSDQDKRKLAHFEIINDDEHSVINQLQTILNQLIN